MKKMIFFLGTTFFSTYLYSQIDSTVRTKEFLIEGQYLIPTGDHYAYAFYSSKGEKGVGYFMYSYVDSGTIGPSLGIIFSGSMSRHHWEYEIGLGGGADIALSGRGIEPTGITYGYFASIAAKQRAAHKVIMSSEWFFSKTSGYWTLSYVLYAPFQKLVSIGWHYQTDAISGPKVALNVSNSVRLWSVFAKMKTLAGLSVDVNWDRKKKK
jgi:hypothetical protein